jgi:protein-S-isoprenylcysteine O-methyltransferase
MADYLSAPANRPTENGKHTPEVDAPIREREASNVPKRGSFLVPRVFYPGGDRSLAGIAIRAFCLGGVLVLSALLSAIFVYYESRLWRPAAFIATLCVFHFLEFWVTAQYNTPIALVASFLLTNGERYRQAHTFAFIESAVTSYFFPGWQARVNPPVVVALGVGMVIVGQLVRSLAMAQAGTNFNHQVQSTKKDDHELVTSGLYAYLRHPSYFGFFWWGLGTQVLLGNCVSLAGYAGVLWYFFYTRITRKSNSGCCLKMRYSADLYCSDEEKHLISFFGDEYKAYKARTRVWIPFIR